ncbi:hypothetical protein ORV05_02455 [Amycolatopsis cynarae]|uniref:Uncharacterized protein n=1 Tax=Amycolatopsis cynarae TaxID=2995223 RepID=A0ABY7B629_9PSEU|nr:hypothetical protein [Amycolatopsis sp. HUAS 11-8]WAL66697.1 hypothetical protein ORV05_02455 [Amycolatopsis sp. HUAS 11-8]
MLQAQGPTFLPLTADAAARIGARTVLSRATEADETANACWTSLLAGCSSAVRWGLDTRLRRLSEATSVYVGTRWWFSEGSAHRRRVANAQTCIEEAITEGDGQEFAKAFMGYDHAMACAVVAAGQGQGRHRRS